MSLQYPSLEECVEVGIAELRRQLPQIDPTVAGSWARAFITGGGALAFTQGLLVRDLERQAFPQTATDEYLDRWGNYENLSRTQPTPAAGTISQPGTYGTLIPAGTAYSGGYLTSLPAAVENNVFPVASLVRTGGIATATTADPHGFATGMSVQVTGASDIAYNGLKVVAVLDAVTFTYAVSGAPATPAAGTITAAATYASVPVQAQVPGSAGNLPPGALLTLQTAIPGITGSAYVQPSGVGGGADLESDGAYRARILLSRSLLEGVYTPDQVRLAALSIPGNTRVFVVRPNSAGSGTPGVAGFQPAPGETAVYVVRDGDSPITPPQVVLDQTKQAVIVDGRLPAHTREQDVHVMAPTLVTVDFNFTSITPDTSTMRAAIQAQLTAVFGDSVDFEESVDASTYLSALYATRDLTTGQGLAAFSLSTPAGDIAVPPGGIAALGPVTFA
ncbi:baseplate J/gp47 family protein [Lysobacter sp. GCM10012299]|uniref:baseplate J/gp47 family protein n=1 Tax=Lysobacter sp. GCM10012299 TaxID=3317333 RepID=UPI00361EFB8E